MIRAMIRVPWVEPASMCCPWALARTSGGVPNFNADQMRRIADHLARAGVPLAANQVNYSLLRRAAETNGVLEACRELDVALVAYFPRSSGRLARPSDGMG